MVSVAQAYPTFVREGDTQAYLDRADPPADVASRLRQADGDESVRLLARAWGRQFHGSRHEAKKLFVMFMKERNIPFTGEDIQAITTNPPVETQT